MQSPLASDDTTNTKEALSLCDAAIAKHSNGAEEFHHMSIFNDLYIEALIYLKLNDWQNALSAANNAIEIKRSSDYLLAKAKALEMGGNFDDSIKILTELKESEPSKEVKDAYDRVNKMIIAKAIRNYIQ